MSAAVLLICVEGSASEAEAQACSEPFEGLVDRHWTYPPAYVDQLDELPDAGPDELSALRTVGVCMTLPDAGDAPSEDAVRRDVAALVTSMSELASQARIEFVVEYRNEAVGFLDGGADDARFLSAFFGDAAP